MIYLCFLCISALLVRLYKGKLEGFDAACCIVVALVLSVFFYPLAYVLGFGESERYDEPVKIEEFVVESGREISGRDSVYVDPRKSFIVTREKGKYWKFFDLPMKVKTEIREYREFHLNQEDYKRIFKHEGLHMSGEVQDPDKD